MTNRLLPSDPLFSQQWFLYNTGQAILGTPQEAGAPRNDINVTQVWPDYTGKGVRVGVIDDGFDESHPDLVANYRNDLSYDFSLNQPGAEAADAGSNHGTPVLGLIAETQNGIGGTGIAYNAQAVGYRAPAEPSKIAGYFHAAATKALADGIDTLNNSYGSTGGDSPFASAGTQASFNADFKRLATDGRGGLGIVDVFAGGNDRSYNFLTSYDPTNASPYAINVAAAKADGTVTSYSTVGPNLLVAAPGSDPGSIVTTDRQGSAGYNDRKNGDYTETPSSAFNGTSAAAPMVTGVVALMLQANPNLGYRDVQEILAYSARMPQGGKGLTRTLASDWNGGDHGYSTDLGFGNVDALAAVRMAETWTKRSTAANMVTETLAGTGGTVAAGAIGQFSTAADLGPALRLQHVTMDVDLDAPSLAGVTLELVSGNAVIYPDKTVYSPIATLLDKPNTATPITHLTYTFDTTNEWGAMSGSLGNYVLQVTNTTGGTVALNSFSVHLMGDAASPDHTYVYTNDYAALAASNLSREKLRDASTGSHTINAAAVTGGSTIDLRPGGTGNLGGTYFETANGMTVKTVYTGDGDDVVYANGLGDTIGAGRGTNAIHGGAGQDTAVLIGSRAGYQLGLSAAGITVNSNDGATQDTLTSIEALRFADASVDLAQANKGQFIAGAGGSGFGHAYTGPAPGLQWEFAAITPQSVVVGSATPNVFLHSGAGDDALAAMSGSNVLDGGGGSNWLVGATGTDGGHDTFFVSGLLDSQVATSWDTVLNFHTGDMLTVWGYDAARDSLSWQDNQGAAGYTGATLTISSAGRSAANLVTLAGLTTADAHVVTTTGSVGGLSYLALTKAA